MDKFHTIREVAELLHLNPQTVYRMVYQGVIKGNKFGGAVRISQAEIDKLVSNSTKG